MVISSVKEEELIFKTKAKTKSKYSYRYKSQIYENDISNESGIMLTLGLQVEYWEPGIPGTFCLAGTFSQRMAEIFLKTRGTANDGNICKKWQKKTENSEILRVFPGTSAHLMPGQVDKFTKVAMFRFSHQRDSTLSCGVL